MSHGPTSGGWTSASVTVRIEETGRNDTVLVSIVTPVGTMEVIGEVVQIGRTLYVRRAHVQGLSRGSLGRAGLNAVGEAILRDADVSSVVIEGGPRTTGRPAGRGKRPPPIRYPR